MKKSLMISICCLFSLQAMAQVPAPASPAQQPLQVQQPAAKPADKSQAAVKPEKKVDDVALYRKSGNRSETWNEIVEEGLQAFMDGNIATGVSFLERAVKLGCKDGLVNYKLGQYFELKGDYAKAIDFYKIASANIFRQYPKTPYAAAIHEAYGRALFTVGKLPEAKGELEAAIRQNTKSLTPFFLLSQIYKSEGNSQQAIDYLLMAKTLPLPTDIATNVPLSIALELAQGYYQLGDTDTALVYAKEALGYEPNNPIAMKIKNAIESSIQKKKERELIEKFSQ